MIRLALSALVALTLVGCKERVSPEEEIQRMLDEGVSLLEKGDISGAGDLISDDYMDKSGRDKKTLKRIAFFMMRAQKVSFFLRETEIVMADDLRTAEVKTKVIVGARRADITSLTDALPSGVRKLPITLRVAKLDGDWRVVAIEGDGLKGGG
jgi:hypothetical protein